jgi:ABC-type amino acid transport substrate-binding protein
LAGARTAWTRLAAVGLVLAIGWTSPVSAGSIEVPAKGVSKTIDKIREQKELRAGVAVSPPFLAQDPNTGKWFGPAQEIGERAASLLNVELKLIPTVWSVIIAGLQGNRFEVALAPLFATEKRKQVVDFVTYVNPGTCYLVMKDNPKPINTLEDMNKPSVIIGTWTGGGTEQNVLAKYPKAGNNSIPMPVSGVHRIEDLLTRRIDVVPFDSALARVFAQEYPQFKILPGGTETCMKNPDVPAPLGLAFNYGDAAFKKFWQDIVTDMKDQIAASTDKYGSVEYLRHQVKPAPKQ